MKKILCEELGALRTRAVNCVPWRTSRPPPLTPTSPTQLTWCGDYEDREHDFGAALMEMGVGASAFT